MRTQQTACQHIENLNRVFLILDGYGHSGDYEKLITVLASMLDDLQDAAQAIEELSSELRAMRSARADHSAKLKYQISGTSEADTREKPIESTAIESTAIKPYGISTDCPAIDGPGGESTV